jgi:hypothetical protein
VKEIDRRVRFGGLIMQRVTVLAVFALIATSMASAGQIQIGGTNGLTSTYVGSQTGWLAKNYDTRLFQTTTEAGSLVIPTYTTGSYQYATPPYQTTAATLTDSSAGVTFAMIADGTSSGTSPQASNNFWEGYQATTLTIPVGIFDVTDVWTMMNNIWGTPGAVDTTVTFDFGAAATGAVSKALIVQLTNAGSNATGTPSGQISTSVDCTTVGSSTCASYAIGPTAASSSIATSGSGSSTLSNITVLTDRVLSMGYNGGGGTSVFAGSSGNVVLGDQGFQFGTAFNGLYLVDVKIAEASGTGNTSQTALSAITVDATTPEPSTVWLLLSGFGAAGLSRLRRKK